jgi:putative FmdB family regulatory protein
MPTYTYVCNNCKERIEIEASIEEKEKGINVKCPECGSKDVYRVFDCFVMGSEDTTDSSSSCPTCGCGGGSCGL